MMLCSSDVRCVLSKKGRSFVFEFTPSFVFEFTPNVSSTKYCQGTFPNPKVN